MLRRRNKENANPYDRVIKRNARNLDGALIPQKAVLALRYWRRRVLALALLVNDSGEPQ
jgi:hypothetical protein